MTELENLENLISSKGGGAVSEAKNEDYTNSSILEFLNQENRCLDSDNMTELDVESIFDEINRLTVNTSDDRDVDEILKEAEELMQNQNTSVDDVDSLLNFSSNDEKSLKLSRSGSESTQIDESIIIKSPRRDEKMRLSQSDYEIVKVSGFQFSFMDFPLMECVRVVFSCHLYKKHFYFIVIGVS